MSWAGSAWPGRRHQCQDAATGGAATGTRRLRRRRDLGILPSQVDPSQATSCSPSWTAGTAGPWGISWLTAVERRLLPLLATHLSFAEIGERLYVSRHTVKTQAMSMYRKLGVSSRSLAVQRLQQLGLLEG